MKKTILTIIVASTTLFACNNSCEKPSCGTEGHTCTSECAAKEESKSVSTTEENNTETTKMETELADHVCSADCKEGSCVLVHGEKGHKCGSDCL